MPSKEYAAGRTDTDAQGFSYIGKAIKEIVRLMTEEGVSWQTAADTVGLKRDRAYRALHKAHVVAYRLDQKKKLTALLSTRVPRKLSELMDSENHAAACRAAIALDDMAQQGSAEPTRRIQTGGIVIVLGAPAQQPLPAVLPAMPVIEAEPAEE